MLVNNTLCQISSHVDLENANTKVTEDAACFPIAIDLLSDQSHKEIVLGNSLADAKYAG